MEQKIKDIKHKLQLLIKQYQQLQKENLQLKKQVEKFVTKEQEQGILINELQQKVDTKIIQHIQLTKEDKKSLEKRIDGYLKEIKTCLTLLNKD